MTQAFHIESRGNVVFFDQIEAIQTLADKDLWTIAQETAKAVKAVTPKRAGGRKALKQRKNSPRGEAPGGLKRSVKAKRFGRRKRIDGKWSYLVSRMVIRMRWYGRLLDAGWDHARAKRHIEGTHFVTREINKRLVRS